MVMRGCKQTSCVWTTHVATVANSIVIISHFCYLCRNATCSTSTPSTVMSPPQRNGVVQTQPRITHSTTSNADSAIDNDKSPPDYRNALQYAGTENDQTEPSSHQPQPPSYDSIS